MNVSVVGLERALLNYCSAPNEEPFDIKTVPIETTPMVDMPKCMLIYSTIYVLITCTCAIYMYVLIMIILYIHIYHICSNNSNTTYTIYVLLIRILRILYVLILIKLFLAIGEVTPGATVQKIGAAPAASKQDIYAGTPYMYFCFNPSSFYFLLFFLFSICFSILFPTEQLAAVPEFSKLGPLFKSADKPLELTESETEYVVRCVKHTFQKHIVFQV